VVIVAAILLLFLMLVARLWPCIPPQRLPRLEN
jgi:hypothetical protein